MAIRFSLEDNFIGRIYSNRRLIWNQKVNKQPPSPPPPEKKPRPDAANTKSDQQNPAVYWVQSVSCLRLTKLIFTYYDQLCRFQDQCVFLI